MEKNQKKYLGFTLFEVLITVIIVGGLASLAIPQYRMIREQFIANEGKSILITLVGSLKRFSTDVGVLFKTQQPHSVNWMFRIHLMPMSVKTLPTSK